MQQENIFTCGTSTAVRNKGFTLIELLVVVLIIGILAAVALPQYQIAVGKTRLINSIPATETTIKAAQAYYLANGKFPDDKDSLDIQTPCIIWKNHKGAANESFVISCQLYGHETAHIRATFYSPYSPQKLYRYCVANKNYPQTVKLCKKITEKQTPSASISDLFLYQYENSNF